MLDRLIVYKKVSFDAAHYLPHYVGKCQNLHGHCWTVEVGVRGCIDAETGMVADFKNLKAFLREAVVERFDHTLLNDVLPNPTAENLVQYVREAWGKRLPELMGSRLLVCVRVWETEDSYAEWVA